ncbi:dihydroneopterin aldolase [Acetobacter pasteurianus]|uniref:7,8-dihydroneopterin aldolase n=6 Tax=Acetobacter TaxID=434 RepID=A0A1Y0Y9C7_ACEPA|nr:MULTISPECIES: dihydroneopterin aldolase [Acetobacter]BAU37134.1 dihydroneopterin aldolase [Acetobacter pasteurianus NBRC 101655]GBR58497.1 dihydroneopterin aldolase [Acetobacter senegalensis DSM 18889]AKR48244.1 diguanylate cyclase [Acetobacter pasteurianus]ARW47595.1 Dihydroneopterin aldolase [Acetobacter pasteurianus subsp. pasteurianus]ASC05542.1 Dihydroneopterin aldolase [Acetobacter pasteurianus subsp. pasteurianus]
MAVFAPWADQPPLRRLFIRNMILDANIGVFPHEQGVSQRIRVSVSFGVDDRTDLEIGADDLSRTVSYEQVVVLVRQIVAEGHVRLVETLAERIAAGVLADNRVKVVRVRIEKLDVFEEIEAVGVEIERRSTPA